MSERALAAVVVVAAWWIGTAGVMRLVWRPRRTHRASLIATSALGLLALGAIVAASERASVGAAYAGFLSALVVWGWHELTFLIGAIAGPRRVHADPSARGWRRFREATETVIHHEIALALTGAAIVALTWDAPNQVATWTFLVLWSMRLSAKLNLFLGVRNVSAELVPERLRYLVGYFRTGRVSPLMPVSLLGAGAATFTVGARAWAATGAFDAVAFTLVGSLLLLAVLEHLFLALPLRDAALFRWVLRSAPAPTAPRLPAGTSPEGEVRADA